MPPREQLGLLLIAAGILVAAAVWIVVMRKRRHPHERERRRRLAVSSTGRLGDATITDIHDGTLFYCYTVRGVYYAATQDVSQIQTFLPEEPARLIGPATLKYLSSNPANSIIICEDWSGLRASNKVNVHPD